MIQGNQKRLWLVIFLWRNQKIKKIHKSHEFWKPYIGRFWYFDVQYVSGVNYYFVSWLWQNSVTAPYCRDWEPRYPKTHPSAFDFHEYHSDTPRYPPYLPQTPPRRLQWARDANRQQQTPTDTGRCTQTALVSVFGCLGLSVCVWWRLLLSVGISLSLDMSIGCLGDVWVRIERCLSVIHGNQRHSDVFGSIWVLSPCSMEP